MMMKYQIFGSPTSVDLDVCFFVERLQTIHENHHRISSLIECTDFETNKKVNANIAIVKNGKVYDCFKGSIDELNNALFLTYQYHTQKFNCEISGLVERNIDSKIERCARTIVSYFTRTDLRVESKIALKSDVKAKIEFLRKIDLKKYDDFGKHGTVIEVYKSIAFQLGQTLGLLDGIEVFTKKDITERYPELESYLFRIETSSKKLGDVLKVFVDLKI